MGDLPIGELACRREFAHGGFAYREFDYRGFAHRGLAHREFAYREFAYRNLPIGDLPIRRGFDKQIHKQIYKQNTSGIQMNHKHAYQHIKNGCVCLRATFFTYIQATPYQCSPAIVRTVNFHSHSHTDWEDT